MLQGRTEKKDRQVEQSIGEERRKKEEREEEER